MVDVRFSLKADIRYYFSSPVCTKPTSAGNPIPSTSNHQRTREQRRCGGKNYLSPACPVDLFCKKITFQDMKKILIIVPDGGMLFESAGIADILMQANRLHPEGAGKLCYQVQLATTQPHQVIHGQSGLNLLADHRLHEIDPREPLDTIMITGRGQNPQEGIAVVDWLRLAAPHASRIASICGGALLLAQTGLLDGRRATTHWKLLDTLQAEFPQVRVEGGPLYIQDEHIWTSGGVSSGFDLTLALVEEDYGFSLARDIAQDFVMYLRRPGGQLQFSRYNLQQTSTLGPINDLLAWLLENLTADLSVDKLAERVAMSPRNFTRVFTRETGASPARYVAEARLAAARQRLEQTNETLDRIAEQTGFGSSINLRRLFEKQLHLTPGEYRQRFHCRKMA